MADDQTYEQSLIERVKQDVARDTANFQTTLLHGRGLYRHWRCGQPGRSHKSFHIITWPGSLCYTGDMGTYLFERTEDMLELFRRRPLDIHYFAKKCTAKGDAICEFRDEVMEEEFEAILATAEDEETKKEYEEKITAIRDEYETYDNPADAFRAMYESDLWDELPRCRAYSYIFLWAMFAIEWFTDRLREEDAERKEIKPSEEPPSS